MKENHFTRGAVTADDNEHKFRSCLSTDATKYSLTVIKSFIVQDNPTNSSPGMCEYLFPSMGRIVSDYLWPVFPSTGGRTDGRKIRDAIVTSIRDYDRFKSVYLRLMRRKCEEGMRGAVTPNGDSTLLSQNIIY